MTIAIEDRKAGPYKGNGVSSTFPFGFKVFQEEELLVIHADPGGAETTLVFGQDYSVALNPDQDAAPGGSVVLSAPLAVGARLVISSSVRYLQPTNLTNSGGFYPEVLNDALDRVTILTQQNAELAERSVVVPITDERTPAEFWDDLLVDVNTSEANAAASAAQAEHYKNNASDSADAAAGAVVQIRNRDYGPLPFDPTQRPDGTPSQPGDEYFNTTDQVKKVYSGSEWFVPNVDGQALSKEFARQDAEYGPGIIVSRRNQTFWRDGVPYRPNADLTLSYTTTGDWGVEEGLFVAVGDQALRQELASPDGSSKIGYGETTVESFLEDSEQSIATIENRITREDLPDSFSTEADSYYIPQFTNLRTQGQIVGGPGYDHFGIFDIMPNNEFLLSFRRGISHETDPGSLVVATTKNGIWGDIRTIVSEPQFDYRGAAGGVMPNGKIAIATAKKTPGVADWREMSVYVSDDYGDTFNLVSDFEHNAPLAGRSIYGKGRQIGDRYVIPYYGTNWNGINQAGWYYCSFIISDDGGETFYLDDKPSVFNISTVDGQPGSSEKKYNETDVIDLGGGYVYAVSRIGQGFGGEFQSWLSSDNGDTFVDNGRIPAPIGQANNVVAPSLEYVVSESGKPFVLLFYTDRTIDFCEYRYASVNDIIAGNNDKWSENPIRVFSAPNLSGYQSTVRKGDRVFGTVFRETTLDAVARPHMFEVVKTKLPDYETSWIDATVNDLYLFSHGLNNRPRKVEVIFSEDPATGGFIPNSCYQLQSGGANAGVGALVSTTATQIGVRTGTYALFTGTGFASGVSRVTACKMKVRAYL